MSILFRRSEVAESRDSTAEKEENEYQKKVFEKEDHVEEFRDAAVGIPHEVHWRLALNLSVCLTVIMVLYVVEFAHGRNETPRYLLDIFYAIDFCLHLLLTFHPKKKILVYRERSIQTLAVDFISLLPLELLIDYRWELNRILRIYRPLVYFHVGRHSVQRHPVLMMFLECFVMILLCASLAGAILSAVNCDRVDTSNCQDYLTKERPIINQTDNDPWRRYLYVQASMIKQMTQRGHMFGDSQRSVPNKVVTMCLTLVHLVVFLGVIFPATVSAIAQIRGTRFTLAETLPLHKATLQVRNCPAMIKSIVAYYHLQWEERRGVIEELEDMQPLPSSIQDQVRMDAHWDLLRHSRLFSNTDVRTKKKITRIVQSWHLPPGHVVFGQGQTSNRLVYIVSGTVRVMLNDTTQIALLGAGSTLGAVNLFHDVPSAFTVRCITYCIFDYMTRRRFQMLADEYPALRAQVEWDFRQRVMKARSTQQVQEELKRRYPTEMEEAKPASEWMHDMFRRFTSTSKNPPPPESEQPVWKAAYTTAYLDEYVFALKEEIWTPPFCSKCPKIFQPGSFFIETWNKIFAAVIIVAAFVVPYYAIVVPRVTVRFVILFIVMEVLNLIDFAVLLVTAIKTRDGLVTHPRKITPLLLRKWWFYVDILTIISFFFLFIERSMLNPFVALCTLLHVIRLYRIVWTSYVSRMVSLSYINGWAVTMFLLLLLFPVYFWAVMFYACTCTYTECGVKGWTEYIEWQEVHPLARAILHMSMMATCMAFVETPLKEDSQILLSTGAKITLFIVYIFIVSYFSSFLDANRYHKIQYNANRYHMMRVMHHRKVKESLQKRVLYCLDRIGTVCDYRLPVYSGHIKYFLPQHINLYRTSQDIISFLESVPFFKGAPTDFITAIARKVKIHVLPPRAIPVMEGKYSSHLFIIEDGICENIQEKEGRQVLHRSTDAFPVIELLGWYPALRSIQTITNCRLYTIDFFTFKRILAKYRDIEKIYDQATREVLSNKTVQIIEDDLIASKDRQTKDLMPDIDLVKPSFLTKGKDKDNKSDKFILVFIRFLIAIILPHGRFLSYWEMSRIICAILTCILFPLRRVLGFYYSVWFIWGFMILDLAAYIDIYTRFRHAYHDNDGWVVVNRGKICLHYLTHSFITDLFACFPFDLFFNMYLQSEPVGVIGSLLYNNRVIQIYRIRQTRAILQRFDIEMNHLWVIALSSLLAVITVNTLASYYMVHSCTLKDDYMECPSLSGTVPDFRNFSYQPLHVYLWYFSYFFCVILGNSFARHKRELYVVPSIVLTLIGLCLNVIAYSYAIAHYTEFNLGFLSYKWKLKQLIRFMDEGKVNERVRNAVIDYNEMYWLRTRNQDAAGIFEILHPTLCSTVLLEMFQLSLRKCRVLSDLGDDALRMVLPEARFVIYSRRCRLCRINDVIDSAMVVVNGNVLVEGPDRNPEGVFGSGMMFGNLDTGTWNRVNITVVAVDHQVEVLRFRTERLFERLRCFPMFEEVMEYHLRFRVDYVPPVEKKLPIASSVHLLEGEDAFLKPEGDEEDLVLQREKRDVGMRRLHNCARYIRWAFGFDALHPYHPYPVAIWTILCICAIIAYIIVLYQLGASIPLAEVVAAIYFLDIVHVTAILFTLRCGYFDKHGLLVMNKRLIRRRYTKSVVFYCDIISVIPADVIPMAMGHYMMASFFRINRLLRLVKVCEHLKVHTSSLQSIVWIRRFGYIILMAGRVILSLGAALAFLRKLEDDSQKETASFRVLAFFNASHAILIMLASGELNELTMGNSECMLFFLAAAMTTHITWLLIVVWCCAYVGAVKRPLEKYVRNCVILDNYVKARSMSKPIVDSAVEYMRLLWHEWGGRNEPKLLLRIPHIMQQALRSSNYGNTVRSYGFYRNLHVDFMRQVLEGVRRCYYYKGNEIAPQGIADGCTYFIFFGEVDEIIEGLEFEEELERTLKQGEVFGIVQGVFPDWPHRRTYRAHSGKSSVLYLHHESWQRLLPFFPAAKDEMFNSANSMYIFAVNK